jgi:RNA-directed DNA polymerase
MRKIIKEALLSECMKLIGRHYEYLYQLEENTKRKSRRISEPVQKIIKKPSYWSIDPRFDPFTIRKSNRVNNLSFTLDNQLRKLEYSPKTAIIYEIPKESGKKRELNVFQIPDAAISMLIYKSLLSKNVNLFSAYAYAYREDRNIHDAIMNISSGWRNQNRVYIAEFDFSKFFDKISHEYLWKTLVSYDFLYTEIEEYVIKRFLTSDYASAKNYNPDRGEKRIKGIPQGTSISLFLANVACYELDHELESIGVHFCRYADDTLIWTNSYEKIVNAYDIINFFSKQMDVPINFKKSDGISIISEKENEEMTTKKEVVYLGYNISLRKISISPKSIINLKCKISYMIYENLLQPLNNNIFNENRLNLIDWDYLTALGQIRRYLYGGLDDTKLRQFRFEVINQLHFRGFMSYYPLVNDEEQLKKLDGWLIYSLKQALLKRENIWHKTKGIILPGPKLGWINDIENIKKWIDPNSGIRYDFRIPSFLMINKTIRIGLRRGGIQSVMNPKSKYYPGYISPKYFL